MYPPLAASSLAFDKTDSFARSSATIVMHGVPFSISAITPCLSSPPANPRDGQREDQDDDPSSDDGQPSDLAEWDAEDRGTFSPSSPNVPLRMDDVAEVEAVVRITEMEDKLIDEMCGGP